MVWASYAALLGYIGGKAFADNHTLAFLVAFGCALAVTGVIEAFRWIRHRGRPDPLDVLDDAALDGAAKAPAGPDDVSRSS